MKHFREAHVIVSGRVQGVFFRASTRDVATRHGVCGFVRNLPGQRVEVVLQGDREAVENVIAFLREGPPGAVVTDIDIRWRNSTTPHEGFHVRY